MGPGEPFQMNVHLVAQPVGFGEAEYLLLADQSASQTY